MATKLELKSGDIFVFKNYRKYLIIDINNYFSNLFCFTRKKIFISKHLTIKKTNKFKKSITLISRNNNIDTIKVLYDK